MPPAAAGMSTKVAPAPTAATETPTTSTTTSDAVKEPDEPAEPVAPASILVDTLDSHGSAAATTAPMEQEQENDLRVNRRKQPKRRKQPDVRAQQPRRVRQAWLLVALSCGDSDNGQFPIEGQEEMATGLFHQELTVANLLCD